MTWIEMLTVKHGQGSESQCVKCVENEDDGNNRHSSCLVVRVCVSSADSGHHAEADDHAANRDEEERPPAGALDHASTEEGTAPAPDCETSVDASCLRRLGDSDLFAASGGAVWSGTGGHGTVMLVYLQNWD